MSEAKADNVFDNISKTAQLVPDHISMQIKEEGGGLRCITYRELIKTSRQYAKKLTDCGILPGSIVVILSESIPQAVESLLAAFAIHVTVVILDPSLPNNILADLMMEINPLAILSSNKQLEKIAVTVQHVIPVLLIENELNFYQYAAQKLPFLSKANYYEDTAIIIFTSGTSGNYRGVMISHAALFYQIKTAGEAVKVTSNDLVFFLLPFNHIAPLIAILNTLYGGATLHFVTNLESQEIFAQLSAIKPTIFPMVPRILELITKSINKKIEELSAFQRKTINLLAKFNLILRRFLRINLGRILFKKIHQAFGGRLRYFLVGSAPLKPEIHQRLLQFGFDLLYGYGLTETTNIATLTKLGELRLRTVGKPLKGIEVKIHNPNEKGIGEILIKSPSLMQGYLNDEETTQEVIKDHWLYTGDLGYFDKDDYLYVTGRLKEIIVTQGGKKAPPLYIESQYGEIEGVLEYAVFGVPIAEGYDAIYAAIVIDLPYKEKNKNAEELIKESFNRQSQQLPHQFRVQKFYFTDTIPKTNTLKVKRTELRNKVITATQGEKAREVKPFEKKNEKEQHITLKQFIHKTIVELSPERITEDFSNRQSFFELGMDSLMAAELCQRIQVYFKNQVILPVSVVNDYPTVEGLAKVVTEMVEDKDKNIYQLLPPLRKMRSGPINPVSLQQQYWLERQAKTDLRAGYISICFSLDGEVDFERFKSALHQVAKMQQILRTTFLLEKGKFLQKVNDDINFSIRCEDLSHEKNEEMAIRNFCNQALTEKCNYENGPLGCCYLLKLVYCRSAILVAFHHLIFDGLSIWVFLSQLNDAYEHPELLTQDKFPTIQYADFALWQLQAYQGSTLVAYQHYWTSLLMHSKPFTFPYDQESSDYKDDTISYYLPSFKENLTSFIERFHGTEFCLYYFAFLVMGASINHEYDITISVPQSGRFDPQLNNLIGFFASTCLSRIKLSKLDTVADAFAKVDKHLRELMRYYIPYQLVKSLTRNTEANTDYHILFSYMKNSVNGSPLLGHQLEKIYETSQPFHHDMMWYLLEYTDQVTIYCTYNLAKYKKETVLKFLDQYTNTVTKVLALPEATLEEVIKILH